MKKSLLAGASLAAAVASVASAGFTGWSVDRSVNSAGNVVYKVYANFDANNFVFLNVFNFAQQSGNLNAFHSGTGAGTWVPQGTSTASHVGNDSWVTATGTHVGSQVALDPGFVEFDEYGEPIPGVDAQIPNGAGWYDATPGTANNVVNNKFMIMQIVREGGAGDEYVASLQIGFKVNGTTTALFGQGSYTIGVPVPAPGAMALLGLAGLAGRRRR
ncbi:MAG: hypothetical protein ACO3DS_01500 [Phycisphaerales bacterium]